MTSKTGTPMWRCRGTLPARNDRRGAKVSKSWRLTAAMLIAHLITFSASSTAHADALSDGQWYVNFMRLSAAWKVSTGAGVSVAVVDSGVDAHHPTLKGRVLAGADFSGGGQASIGDGRVDNYGHGTQMASLIVAHGKVQGVAPGAVIVPVRDAEGGESSAARIGEGIRWAAEHQVDVISISAGVDDDPRLREAIDIALSRGIVVVAGVGNTDKHSSVMFPAAYPGVIGVCAVDKAGNHAPISVQGHEVDLCAPGERISSALPGNSYGLGTGTSSATALVAGAAALVRSKFPNLSAAEVVQRLTATATDKGVPGRDPVYGYGVVNVIDALTKNVPPLHPTLSRPPQSTAAVAGPDVPASDGLKPWHALLGGLLCLVVLAAGGITALQLGRRR